MQAEPSLTEKRESNSRFFAATLVAFVLIGIVNTFLGPLLPTLSARWNLDYSEAGYLFTMQFAGAIVGAASSGALAKRAGIVRLITIGLILMAASVACISLRSRSMGSAAIFCSGVSLGVTIPTINLAVAEMRSRNRAESLNILNFAWGVGAVSAPFLIARLAHGINITIPLLAVSSLLIALSILTAFFTPLEPASAQASERVARSDARIWLNSQVWLGALFIFVYVGVETATGGWLAAYAKSLDPATGSNWATVQSLFWAGLLMGRMAAPLFLRYVSGAGIVFAGATVAVAGIAIILAGESMTIVSIGATVAGFGMAPVFPTMLALLTEQMGSRASQVTGYLFVAAGLGGAVIPWVVGHASALYGSLRAGLSVTLAGAISLVVLQAGMIVRLRQSRHHRL